MEKNLAASEMQTDRKRPSISYHKRGGCKVCAHPQCKEIETRWTNWESASRLAREYKMTHPCILRHMLAFGLREKRARNLRIALEKIIEQAGSVKVTASAVVAAAQAYSKINSYGVWIEKTEQVNLNELFEKMTSEELRLYAEKGVLPEWFRSVVGALPTDNSEDQNND
jgi:hypothetical protein